MGQGLRLGLGIDKSPLIAHCANEMARFSKNSSELGIVKDSASMR